MKATGIVRRIDDLGRVVIPKEIRRTMRIRDGEPLEIYTDREGEIILKKYSPIGELTNFAKDYTEALAQISGCLSCVCDQDMIIAAAGPMQKEFQGKDISKELERLIAKRGNICSQKNEKEYIPVLSEVTHVHDLQVIHTIICAGDAIGAVLILAGENKKAFVETQTQLAAVAADFLGRQMED